MALNNNNHLVDSSGNPVVDFVWGNLPMQPNDLRPDVAPNATPGASNGRLSTSAASSKNPHAMILGGWNNYPLFTGGDKGKFTGSAYTYTPYVVVPSVVGQRLSDAQDALKDAGYLAAGYGTPSAATNVNGAIGVTSVARTVSTSGATLTANNHGFQVGDVVSLFGFTSTAADLNGTFVITNVATNTFTVRSNGTTALSSGTGSAMVTGSRLAQITNVAATAAASNISTVTITTALPHGYVAGEIISLKGVATATALDGLVGVVATVPTTTTFTFTRSSGSLIASAADTGIVEGVTSRKYGITNVAADGTNATVTIGTHAVLEGDRIWVAGTTDTNFVAYQTTVVSVVANVSVTYALAQTITSKADTTGTVYAIGPSTSVQALALGKVKTVTAVNPKADPLVFTAAGHGFAVNDYVTVNGTTTSGVSNAVTSNLASQTQITAVTTNTFTIAKPSGYTLPTAGTVTAASGDGTTATFTSTMNPTAGVTVQITGLVATTGASLNITGVVATTSGSNFTITSNVNGTATATQAGVATIVSIPQAAGTVYASAKSQYVYTQSVAPGAGTIGEAASITLTYIA
jgi:hypothetical protein